MLCLYKHSYKNSEISGEQFSANSPDEQLSGEQPSVIPSQKDLGAKVRADENGTASCLLWCGVMFALNDF